jgi:lysophospholipase L1-like esterase
MMSRLKILVLLRHTQGRRWLQLRPVHAVLGVVVIVVAVATSLTATGASLAQLSARTWYVDMGDSYSSGEGVPPFIPGTDIAANRCHRSTRSYSEDLSGTPGFPERLASFACSGANIANFYPGKGQYNEKQGQLDELGSLNTNVSLVSLTVGGNDVEFRRILTTCVAIDACEIPLDLPTIWLIDKTVSRLGALYQAILAKAPHAQVYILGYPHFFSPHPSFYCNGIDFTEAHWITAMEDRLNRGISSTINRLHNSRLHYVDTSSAFAGGELCSASHPVYMNGIIAAHMEYSFHPTAAGQQRLADVLARAVRGY